MEKNRVLWPRQSSKFPWAKDFEAAEYRLRGMLGTEKNSG